MSMKTILQARGLLDAVPLSAAIDALLEAINPKDPEAAEKGSDVRGKAAVGLVKDTGELSLNLVPPGPNVPFHLVVDEAAASFRLWLILSATEPAKAVFGFVAGLPGRGLIPAVVRTEGPTTWLEPDPAAGPVVLTGLEVALLVEASRGTQARLRFTPTDGAVDGIVALNLEPSTVLLGDSGFGLELSNGLVLDDTDQAVPPGETMLNGTVTRTKADDAEWRGLVVRQARFFVPRGSRRPDRHPHPPLAAAAIGHAAIASAAATGPRASAGQVEGRTSRLDRPIERRRLIESSSANDQPAEAEEIGPVPVR